MTRQERIKHIHRRMTGRTDTCDKVIQEVFSKTSPWDSECRIMQNMSSKSNHAAVIRLFGILWDAQKAMRIALDGKMVSHEHKVTPVCGKNRCVTPSHLKWDK